ncbi:uncharacterized protein [Montipora capricornis]|uniref:uncharacterized protein isoform X1 n=1 Tax=Montipora capricornis TaxID=246305 RepID=UPI0035F1FADC
MAKGKHGIEGMDSLYDLAEQTFTLDKRVEAFISEIKPREHLQSTCARESIETHEEDQAAGPSDSSTWMTPEGSWINEEDNREEIPSSFTKLDAYSPQLTCATKRRAERPGVRGRKRPRLRGKSSLDITEEWLTLSRKTTGPLPHSNSLVRTATEGLRRTREKNDWNKEATPPVTTTDKVSGLRARFEQLSS